MTDSLSSRSRRSLSSGPSAIFTRQTRPTDPPRNTGDHHGRGGSDRRPNLNVGLPVRYMHSPHEVVHLDDLEAAGHLVAAVARRVGEVFEPDYFTPRV